MNRRPNSLPNGRPRRPAEPAGDTGSMAVEMILLAPILVGFLLLVVAFGRYVSVRGEVEAASRDAVRAASMERSAGAAAASAQRTANAALNGWTCDDIILGGAFQAGGTIEVSLRCHVRFSDLGLLGLPGEASVTGDSSAPLDLYRRTG
jgi:hypothetical protein